MPLKKIFIIILFLGLLGAILSFSIKKTVKNPILKYNITEASDMYQEYMFDSGDDRDLGFTHRALAEIRKSEMLLDHNTQPLKNGEDMKYTLLTAEDNKRGVLEKQIYNNDTYELREPDVVVADIENYRMFKNDKLLFERNINFGADGPILDWRIVNDKPAFTVRTSLCSPSGCGTDIFYDGKFLGDKYGVKNPRYLFSSQGKLGFVVLDDKGDKIFFDGAFITPAFDVIHTHNCCSLMEILPTVYENGVLLFYGKRDTENYGNNKNYIVEVKLK